MQISIAQLFALGLAASSAVNGHQLVGNAGVVRRVAGHALMAFAVPALAAPVDQLDVIIRQQVHSELASKRQYDEGADDAADDAQDAADDAADQADDAQDDADDAADDADDAADDADDDADDAADDADDDADDAADDADDAADDADDDADDADDDADDVQDEADDESDDSEGYPTSLPSGLPHN